MPRILHTADLHLAEDRPERWSALEAVLELAVEHRADLLLVAGDLLDRAEDHTALRPRIRELLDGAPCPACLLPGNHDVSAYGAGQDWGGDTHLLLGEPVHVVRVAGLRVVGAPYPADHRPFAAVRRELVQALEGEGDAVAVLHGTLVDAGTPSIQAESRADEPDAYFPIHLEELRDLPAVYVALGHYHQHALRRIGGTAVAYAGSPTPVGSHAWGPRTAVLAEVEGGEVEVEALRLPVPYRDRTSVWLTPFEEEAELEALESRLREEADPLCSLEVRVDGILVGLDEEALRVRIDRLEAELEGRWAELEFDLQGVGLDPGRADLFREFRRRLESWEEEGGTRPDPELRRRALEIGARALKG